MDKLKAIVVIIVGILAGVVICFNTSLLISAYSNPNHVPSVLGVSPLIVMSGSMASTFDKESLIFIEDVHSDELQVGDIITYIVDDVVITHRIVDVDYKGEPKFYTRGDENETNDLYYVTPNQIEGRYIGKIDDLGGVLLFMQTPLGIILFILIPIVLYFMTDWIIWKLKRKKV